MNGKNNEWITEKYTNKQGQYMCTRIKNVDTLNFESTRDRVNSKPQF